MPHLPELADRVWYALHSLSRDENGEPPSLRKIEKDFGLANALLSKTITGKSRHQWRDTYRTLANALRVSEHWLEFGGEGDAPTPTGIVPPRPGMKWMRHGDVRGWLEAVEIAKLDARPRVPPEAFQAGADLPVYRPILKMTPELAIAVAAYAWETSTDAEQTFYSSLEGTQSSAGDSTPPPKLRASPLRRPVAK